MESSTFLRRRIARQLSLFLLLLYPLFLAGSLSAQPVISEFLASNDASLADEDGDFPDWIEIHNTASAPINLFGYALSDDPEDLLKWRFPAVQLPANGYLIVFASSKNRAKAVSELHTNFSLNAAGDFLALTAPSGLPVQEFAPEYPSQRQDISYGISASGDTLAFFTSPSPGSANGNGFAGFASTVQFSAKRGFYNAPVFLTLSTGDSSERILYTTDGTPPSLLRGRFYEGPIRIDSTSSIRAVSMRTNFVPGSIETHTYIFPEDVKNQPTMSRAVVDDPAYSDIMADRLRSLPAVFISVAQEDFDGPKGIYTDFQNRGLEAEVPISMEFTDPASAEEFQINAGLRIHGGQARTHKKKPMRLYFRSDYGASRLEFPLFKGSPVQSFDNLVLRSGGHDSWAMDWGYGLNELTETASYMRDEFIRRTELQMGLLVPRGRFVQIFINGTYWGMYNLHERADEDFFSDHLGGNPDEWDVITSFGEASAGNRADWIDMQELARPGIETPLAYEEMKEYLDMDSFIDSLVSRMWSGDHDWLSDFHIALINGNGSINSLDLSNGTVNNRNWYAGRRSRGSGSNPFHFFSWDAEISMGNDRFEPITSRHKRVRSVERTPIPNRDFRYDLTFINAAESAGFVYNGMVNFEEFRLAFADRAYRHLYNNGALTLSENTARIDALANIVREPLVAESARWGNIHGGDPLTRDIEWNSEYEWLRGGFLPIRNQYVQLQFQNRQLLPFTFPPLFSTRGGNFPAATSVELNPNGQTGTIYYTTDGSDPRQPAAISLNYLVDENNAASAFVPSAGNGGSTLGDGWKFPVDPPNAGAWKFGRNGVGYEISGSDYRPLIALDVPEMSGSSSSVFIRLPFNINSPADITTINNLRLKIRYDDGFVAYLNGVEIARRSAPSAVAWNSAASTDHSDSLALAYEGIDVTNHISLLQSGGNMLAIHGLNVSAGSSDFLIQARLQSAGAPTASAVSPSAQIYTAPISVSSNMVVKTRMRSDTGIWSPIDEASFFIGDPPATVENLVISELNYRPGIPTPIESQVGSSRSDFDFIEIKNISSQTISLANVAFTEGITFQFSGSLAPGAHRLVVSNEAAFLARYGNSQQSLIAGIFANNTNLSNSGERILLTGANGSVIRDFTYDDDDPWPAQADGDGASLELIDPDSNPDHNIATNWRASRITNGTPGSSSGNADTDSDGLPDEWELTYFNSLDESGTGDFDNDGLTNAEELAAGTDPNDNDSDNDGLKDGAEVKTHHTDPLKRDTDGDGLSDGLEVLTIGTDPLSTDSDKDGIADNTERISGTDPTRPDSDSDGFDDGLESRRGTDPMSAASQPKSLPSDLVLYSSLDNTARNGQTIFNLAGPVDGQLTGGSVLPGRLGEAISFSAATDHLDYPSPLGDPGSGCMSVSLWLRTVSNFGTQTVLAKENTETSTEGWSILLDDDTLLIRVNPSGSTDTFSMSHTGALSPGQWYHLAFVIDCGTGKLRAYLNGDSANWLPGGLGAPNADLPRGSVVNSASPLRAALSDQSLLPFDGAVDDLAIWRFPLGADEISNIYRGGVAGVPAFAAAGDSSDSDFDGLPDSWETLYFLNLDENGNGDFDNDNLTNAQEFAIGTNPRKKDSDNDGTHDGVEVAIGSDPLSANGGSAGASLFSDLLLYAPLDAPDITSVNAGGIVFDSTSPSENGTIASGSVLPIPGALNGGIFTHDSAVTFGNVHDPGTASQTISLWVRPDGLDGETTQIIAGKGQLLESGWHLAIFGDRFGAVGDDWLVRNDSPPVGTTPRLGVWTHLLLLLDQETHLARLFVNGIEIGYGSESRTIPVTLISSASPLLLGRPHALTTGSNDFIGGLDEFAVWSRALNSVERRAIFNAGQAGLDLSALGGMGSTAALSFSPGSFNVVLNKDEKLNLPLALTNHGDGSLNWMLQLELGGQIPLEDVRIALESFDERITDIVPDMFPFTDGITGYFIEDGTNDMYDYGNILNTNLAIQLPYQNLSIVSAPTALGTGGRYFTRKLPGLFVFAADISGLNYFEITGDLGADSVGSVSSAVLESVRGSRVFRGFLKRVHDGYDSNYDTFDPSVNHLIIVEDALREVSHTFSRDTNNDQHRVSNLANVTRIYHLLFASKDGRLVTDAESQLIMDTFLDSIGVSPGWLGLPVRNGLIGAGGNFDIPLQFDTAGFAPGDVKEAILRIFSNDPANPALVIPISLHVNSPPTARAIPDVVMNEDDNPRTIALYSFISDAEDSDEELAFTIDAAATSGFLEDPGFSSTTGLLTLAPLPDQFGTASIHFTVTDKNGLSMNASIKVIVNPVPDSPVAGAIPNITADNAASSANVNISEFFSDIDPGDTLAYSITGNTDPAIFSSVNVHAQSGLLNIAFAPFVNGSSELTITATDTFGLSASTTFTVTLPEIPAPEFSVSQEIVINPQTGLFEQRITVTNLSPRDIGAVRIRISSLPAGVSVHNASLFSDNGDAWLIYNRTLPAGASVTLLVEYYSPARRSALAPQIDVEVSLRQEFVATVGQTFAIDRLVRLPDGNVLVEFPSEPGQRYIVQYSNDLSAWHDTSAPIKAGGTRVQWIDRGPPNTVPHPSETPSRSYRVVSIAP